MDKIISFFRKNIKIYHLIIFGLGLILILTGWLSWNLYFSKIYMFEENEEYFLDRVKNYYEYHSVYLPKEGEIKVMTLEEMYEKGQMDTLYIPKSGNLCDTNSWVKVYNDGENYHYYTYLKCGKYESDVDHEGPVITLKGESTVYISLNKDYTEEGIEKVVDNIDGEIDISQVEIDNSKVNTKKVGKYEVTYTVRDKLNNETKVIRTVVVARNLTDIVTDATNETNYYQGNVTNNYLLFSGMLYRIINVNSDGTVTLISNEILNNLRADYETYEDSSIDKYLNNEYLNIIHDKSYLVDTEICIDNVDSLDNISTTCTKTIKRKVAILDIQKLQNSFLNNQSYLCTGLNYAITSKVNGQAITASSGNNNCLTSFSDKVLSPIKPVITLKSNLTVTSGNGTYNNPYKLDDYSYGKQQEKINTRLPGEYVNYSGIDYRIMNIDKNNNVALISVGPMTKNVSNMVGNQYLITTVPNDKKFVFSVTEEDNVGYVLNENFIDYVNDNYILTTEYTIPTNVYTKKYNEYSTKKVSAKLSLPKTYDLFAGKQLNTNCSYEDLYIDESEYEENTFYLDLRNGRIYDSTKDKSEYCVRIVATIKGDLLIKKGKGTKNSPYYIR